MTPEIRKPPARATRRAKIIVVGAGPSGGACALALARTGRFEVQVLDKSQYPRVKVCGSGLSPHALTMLDRLGIRGRFAGHGVFDALLVRGPAGGELRLHTGIEAWVVPRAELDQGVIRTAVELGAQFDESTKVLALLRGADGEVCGVRTETRELEADLVVCADGSPSRFASDPAPKQTIRTLMGWWRGTSYIGRCAHMIWDRRLAGYYAWMFPEPGGLVNIGLTIPEHAPGAGRLKALFSELLAEHWGDGLRGAEQVGKWMGHPAVISTSVGKLAERRAAWAGEAARMVSPGTVEGIGFALESGLATAGLIERHFDLQRGLSPLACASHRARTAARVLPKFWVGAGIARAAQVPWARQLGQRVVEGPAGGWLNRSIAAMVGEPNATR